LSPYAEDKIVRCINGSLYDVIIDLRKDSETFGKWFGEELSAENRKMMYVPKGFAHGLITLEPDTEIFYMVTQYYAPEYERGIRWNDPMFNVQWPIEPVEISDKDKNHRDFDPEYHLK
jgi:dTDP-4-dehydrorhamnose 3,5-epimerase